MSKIIIDWDRESGKIEFNFENITHAEAQGVLLAIAMENHRLTMEELNHDNVQSHGHNNGSGGERGDDQQPPG